MNIQKSRTLQETVTTLEPAQVLEAARSFFSGKNAIYSAFPDQVGPNYMTLRGQGGEEIAIGVASASGGSKVTASSYLFDQQIARFFATLPTPVTTV